MDNGRNSAATVDMQRDVLLREGQAVLRSLGEKRLAHEFCQRAKKAPTNEELADLLVEYLQQSRSR